MYKENEVLVTVEDIGEVDTEKFIPKGTEVTFLKVVDGGVDLSKSMVYIRHGKRGLVVPEIAVRPLDANKPLNELAEFNKVFMAKNPELKKYHPNLLLRYFYRALFFIRDLFKKESNERTKEIK